MTIPVTVPVAASVGAVVDDDDRIRGTAFWVTPQVAITCAHVLRSCEGTIRLAPAATDGYVAVTDIVVDEDFDLARLKTDPIAAPIEPLVLTTRWGNGSTVVSHGYPIDKSQRLFPSGHPLDPPGVVSGATPVRWRGSENSCLVIAETAPDRGQSGGPAVDTATNRVIGVLRLVAEDDTSTTYAIPSADLLTRWPELPSDNSGADGHGPVPPSMPISPVGLRARRDPIRAGSDRRLVERSQELAALRAALDVSALAAVVAGPTTGRPSGPERATVQGQAGVGKSALALEYAYLHLADYSAVWWVNASSEVTLAASFRQLLSALRIDPEGFDDQAARDRVFDHLQQRTSWLAVFDNAESRESLEPWLPPGGGGHVLVTSRNPARWRNPIHVGLLDDAAVADWLLAAARSPDTSDEAARAAAHELAAEFDGLALAAAQAIAYISDTGVSLASYHDRYSRQMPDMLGADSTPEDHPDSIARTVAVAVEALAESGHSEGLRLLDLVAYLAPDRIPVDLFPPEAIGGKGDADIDRAVGGLRRLGLVDFSGSEISLHRLTQAVIRARLEKAL